MIITKTRIRKLDVNLPGISVGDTLVFALRNLPDHQQRIEQAGFPLPVQSGLAVLPTVRGPISRFNAEGKYLIHRDQEKETVYRQVEWHWTERHGQDEVPQSGIKDIPYQRYPRTFIPPPSVEFKAATTTSGELLLVTEPLTYAPENTDNCLHTINLFLEYFRECHVLNENLDAIINVEVKRLNWEVLPKGVRSWQELESHLSSIPNFSGDKGKVFRNNLDYINRFGPRFAAVGRAGFRGYVVFGFPERALYVCESIYVNNATYVFGQDWEILSQLTKDQILSHSLQKERIVHTPEWASRINKLLK